MSVRKIAANYLFTGSDRLLKNGILTLSENGTVLAVTDTGGDLKESAGLEFYNGILCPGFVNTHCHLELSHMRGKIAEAAGLPDFIAEIIKHRKSSPEIIQTAMLEAENEMRKAGIAAVGDICNTSDSFELKAQNNIYYHSFLEVFGTSNANAHDIFRNAKNTIQLARQKYGLKISVTPHASYSVGDILFQLIRNEKNPGDTLLSVHNQESISENEFIRNASGELFNSFAGRGFDMKDLLPRNKSSLAWLLEQLPPEKTILLIHNLYTHEKDVTESGAVNANIYWTLCPKSNFFIGGVYPGKYLIEKFPERICIGTDSLASNNKLSILEELFALQTAHSKISLTDLLKFASINGAKALGIDKWFGSFEVDKKPGVLLIENADLQNLRLKKESRVNVLA